MSTFIFPNLLNHPSHDYLTFYWIGKCFIKSYWREFQQCTNFLFESRIWKHQKNLIFWSIKKKNRCWQWFSAGGKCMRASYRTERYHNRHVKLHHNIFLPDSLSVTVPKVSKSVWILILELSAYSKTSQYHITEFWIFRCLVEGNPTRLTVESIHFPVGFS